MEEVDEFSTKVFDYILDSITSGFLETAPW